MKVFLIVKVESWMSVDSHLLPVFAADRKVGLAAYEDEFLVGPVPEDDFDAFSRAGGRKVDRALDSVEIAAAAGGDDKARRVRLRRVGPGREAPVRDAGERSAGRLQHAGVDPHDVGPAISQLALMGINGRGIAPHDDREEMEGGPADGVHLIIRHSGGGALGLAFGLGRCPRAARRIGRGRYAQVDDIDQRVVGCVMNPDQAGGSDGWRVGKGQDQMRVRIDVDGLIGRKARNRLALGGRRQRQEREQQGKRGKYRSPHRRSTSSLLGR